MGPRLGLLPHAAYPYRLEGRPDGQVRVLYSTLTRAAASQCWYSLAQSDRQTGRPHRSRQAGKQRTHAHPLCGSTEYEVQEEPADVTNTTQHNGAEHAERYLMIDTFGKGVCECARQDKKQLHDSSQACPSSLDLWEREGGRDLLGRIASASPCAICN